MKLFLGIDGGQSSTTALIGDEAGRVVGHGRSGPCNHVGAAEGRAKFLSAVGGSLRQALEQVGVAEASFEGACLGFSGGPADKEALVDELLTAAHLIVTHDARIALAGATAGEPGIIVIAGTGSIAFGRNARMEMGRAGGWGYIFGDEGGGFDIARKALRAILKHEEGWGGPTSLRDVFLKEAGARNANDLMHRFYTSEWPRPRIAALAKLVDEAAVAGDSVAHQVLHQAALDLAEIAGAVRAKLFGPAEIAHIAPVGSVFRSAILQQHFKRQIDRNPANWFTQPKHGPAAGALLEAYQAAGLRVRLTDLPAEK